MKISLSLLAATTAAKGGMKEWEVQNAYFAEKEIVLSNGDACSWKGQLERTRSWKVLSWKV